MDNYIIIYFDEDDFIAGSEVVETYKNQEDVEKYAKEKINSNYAGDYYSFVVDRVLIKQI
jgi:hypothetical protein